MPKLLSGFIAKQLAKNLGKQVLPATLIKVTNTARTSGNASGGLDPTETSYAARGWIEKYADGYQDNSTTRRKVRQVALLGASIAGGQVPTAGDRVTIEGATYRITGMPEDGRDPDGAVYLLDVVK